MICHVPFTAATVLAVHYADYHRVELRLMHLFIFTATHVCTGSLFLWANVSDEVIPTRKGLGSFDFKQ